MNRIAKAVSVLPDPPHPNQDRAGRPPPGTARQEALAGVVGGAVATVPLLTTGAGIWAHENSHAVAARLLYGTDSTIQVDGIENAAQIKKARTLREALIAAEKWLVGVDSDKDGHRGWTLPHDGSRLTPLGQWFGRDLSDALGSLAGTIGTELPLFPLFAVGYSLRKRYPFAGYSLMTLALTSHALSMGYAWDAALASQEELEKKVARGHDFADVALKLGRHYDLDPMLVARFIAGGFSIILPAYALAIHLWRKDQKKTGDELIPDAVALASLYRSADTDPSLAGKLNQLLEQYPRRQELNQAEGALEAWLDSPVEQVDSRALKAAAGDLSEQMLTFNHYLIGGMSAEIREERANLRRQFGLATGQDTFEKAIEVASLTKTSVSVINGILRLMKAAAPVTSGLGKALHVLGVIPLAGNYYQTIKDLQNPRLTETARKYSVTGSILAGAGFVAMAGMLAVPGMGLPLLALGLGQGIVQGILARGRQKAIRQQVGRSVGVVENPRPTLGQKVTGLLTAFRNRLVRGDRVNPPLSYG